MGMASQPSRTGNERLMLLRLTLTGTTGNVVAETDLLILHGQKATFTMGSEAL